MDGQVGAILWAQQRILLHHLRAGRRPGSILAGIVLLAWYALWLLLGSMVGWLAARPGSSGMLTPLLPQGLLLVFLYWQLGPILLASQGAALDLRKLLSFPIPKRQLFKLEILLRLSANVEMLILLTALTAGLACNPEVRIKTAPMGLAAFVLFNLLLGAGLKSQLERWLARRRLREFLVLLFVLAAALPQLVARMTLPAWLRGAAGVLWGNWWPWSVAARLALGDAAAPVWVGAGFYLVVAAWYGWRQFARSIQFEPGADGGAGHSEQSRSRLDSLYRLPSRILADPLAVIVEKEVRSLARSPRFRLLFVMGFTFGVLIFLPLLVRGGSTDDALGRSQLTMLCGYALLLLGDVLFWNIFGGDRASSQLYFLQPAPIPTVILGKNLAAGIFVLLEITGIVIVWMLLRLPMDADRLAEAYLAPAVLGLYMVAAGNVASVYYPRPINPEKTTGAGSAAPVRILLILLMPVLAIPVLLAFGARYAFRSQLAFFVLLGLGALLGLGIYRLALETAVNKLTARRERFLEALSAGEGPIRLG